MKIMIKCDGEYRGQHCVIGANSNRPEKIDLRWGADPFEKKMCHW